MKSFIKLAATLLSIALTANVPVEDATVTVSIVGDVTLGTYAGQKSGNTVPEYFKEYGKDYFFKEVSNLFLNDDITLANCEGPITYYSPKNPIGKKYSIAQIHSAATIMEDAGIDCVSLENNHISDQLVDGQNSTIEYLDASGINYITKDQVTYIEAKGTTFGLVANSIWSDDVVTRNWVQTRVAEARETADVVICYYHWGTEYKYTNNAVQKSIAHLSIDCGADVVVGTHPHVLQNMETYNGKHIFYSLGNFCFGANKNPTDKDSVIIQLTFDKYKGTVGTKIIPCYLSSSQNKNDYCPIPIQDTDSGYDRVMKKLEGN